ncbi:MAG: thiolase family protein [Actinobacteria bacterium]|nr:thiolase family protein [Actinomycetota bacterium]
MGAVITGAAEARYERHPPPERTTERLIVAAVLAALEDAGVPPGRVDGLGVASFTLAPDHAVDLAVKMGLKLSWLMEDTNGGASGLNMLQHAARAIEAGDAETIVLCAGDRFDTETLHRVSDSYNVFTRDHLAPLPLYGPNALFAFVTRRHAREHGLEREDYACIPLAQRRWAAANPGAVYRGPLTLADYLSAPVVAPPLRRFDCVPVVSGADAVVLTGGAPAGRRGAALLGLRTAINPDSQEGDGIATAFRELGPELFVTSGLRPEDVDCACVYDDYPVMALIQAADLGLVEDGDLRRFLHRRLLEERWPLNTSGGMLSAGQAGAAGGLHGLVEAVRQLRGQAGERQVAGAEVALVSGYGMVAYRHGACHNAALLSRVAG